MVSLAPIVHTLIVAVGVGSFVAFVLACAALLVGGRF